jgi:hypothetical protein
MEIKQGKELTESLQKATDHTWGNNEPLGPQASLWKRGENMKMYEWKYERSKYTTSNLKLHNLENTRASISKRILGYFVSTQCGPITPLIIRRCIF